jgi:hypothetical protein
VLLFIEIMADKIPIVDSANDAIHTFIRPAAGAILFAAQNDAVNGIDPVLALILGLLAAGGVHAIKATARPVITASTAGIANPFVSLAEDAVAAVATIIALIVPVVAAILVILFLILAIRLVLRWRRLRAARNNLQRAR